LFTSTDFLLGLSLLTLSAPGPVNACLTVFRHRSDASEEAFLYLTVGIFRRCTDKSPTFRIHREMNRAQLLGATVAAVNGQAALSG
jgi:hypothetical protein